MLAAHAWLGRRRKALFKFDNLRYRSQSKKMVGVLR